MSSIKQVQDLEKQIERVKRDNSNLRRMLQDRDGPMDIDVDLGDQSSLQLPAIGSEPKRRKRPAPNHELARTRANVRTFCKGVWKPPALYRFPGLQTFDPPRPELPPRQLTDQLLRAYFSSAHTMFPILHMPTFQITLDDAYRGANSRVSPAWLSMFFAVLATGSLFSPEPTTSKSFYRSAELLESARSMADPWSNDFSLDNSRALILITICLNEMNLKSAAWSWLGNAVRVGQDLGLHTEFGAWPVIEGEMRRRTWWTIYIWDRSLATELGQPCLIDDADCDVSLPAGVDDRYIREDGMLVPNGAEPLTHSLLAVIHVVRSYTALVKALRSPMIAPSQLSAFDVQFKKCLGTFPPACDSSSTVPLAPHFLAPLTYLLHGRLILHRHNLSPGCPPEIRFAAVENCTHVALETAALISRTNAPLTDGTTALLTTHVLRCTMILLLTGYFDHAVTCVRALGSIDTYRDVAVSCGRYLSLFVGVLANKRADHVTYLERANPPQRFGPSRPTVDQSTLLNSLARDEELLVYISADSQASPEKSWLWAGMERETALPELPAASVPPPPPASGGGLFSSELRTGLNHKDFDEWPGWARLENSIRGLPAGTNVAAASTPKSAAWATLPPPHVKSETPTPGIEIQRLSDAPRYASETTKFGGGSASASPGGSASGKKGADSRLSIANII